MQILKELGIDFNKVKKICFLNIGKDVEYKSKYNSFFKSLFSLKNLEKNLIYLSLELGYASLKYIDNNILENLNHLDALEDLRLNNFSFNANFILNLKNLKRLSIALTENISFSQDMCLNLKSLNIETSKIIKNNETLEFPKLEKLRYIIDDISDIDDIEDLNSIIDFNHLKNLKILDIDISNFLHINSLLLENLHVYIPKGFTINLEIEINMLKKILFLKNLKEVSFQLEQMNDEEISKITDTNYSIKKLGLSINTSFILNNLLIKFPNFSELDFEDCTFHSYNSSSSIIEIKENSNSKLNKIKLVFAFKSNMKLFCQSFENLKEFDLSVNFEFNSENIIFPIFNSESKNIFKNLISFKFSQNGEAKYDFLYNIYINLDKMCNLVNFSLTLKRANIEKDFHKEFIKKLLSLKLDSIVFKIYNSLPDYTQEELKEIYPDYKFNRLVVISKF